MDEVLERHQRELLGGLSKEQLIEVLLDYERALIASEKLWAIDARVMLYKAEDRAAGVVRVKTC